MPKQFISNDITILLGTDAHDNIETVRMSDTSHWWLHMDTVPSGHVIIQTSEPTDNTVAFAANICFQHIGSKSKKRALYYIDKVVYFDIIMTPIGNLIYEDLEPGEVEFKSTSRRKLITRSIRFTKITDLKN